MDLLLHLVRLRHLDRQYLEGHSDHLDLLLHLAPQLLKHQHFRWVRGHRLVRGPLMDLRYLVGRKFHLDPWGQ